MGKKLKVLWFSNTPAGYEELISPDEEKKIHTGTWMAAIAKAMIEYAGNDIEVGIAFHYNQLKEKFIYKNLIYYPIFLKHLKNNFTKFLFKARHKIIYDEYIPEYLKIIDDFKPNIIHVFGSEGPFGLIAKYTDIPVVLSIQGNLTVIEWKYFSGFSKELLFKVDKIFTKLKFSDFKSNYRIFQKKAVREREILKDIKYVIGRTDWDRRIASILAPNARYFYNDEILREPFYQAEPAKLKLRDKLVITTITGPVPYKGIETICKAAMLLSNRGVNFVWNIGGVEYEDRLVKAIKKIYKHEYPANKLKFHGKINAQGIIDILSETNIYVMPSHIENSPIALSEAMILGLPVITTLAGGTSSRLRDKVDGLMIQDGDPWSLAGAILELLNNYKIAKEYGKYARKKALQRHNKRKIFRDLLNIYFEIL